MKKSEFQKKMYKYSLLIRYVHILFRNNSLRFKLLVLIKYYLLCESLHLEDKTYQKSESLLFEEVDIDGKKKYKSTKIRTQFKFRRGLHD